MAREGPTQDEMRELSRISRELWEQGGEYEERLRAKCRWEAMTRTAVIWEWGDPRTWDKPVGGAHG